MHILDLIKRRISGKKDHCHLALSVEGGVMRGAITAGMIEEVHRTGFDKIFDTYWGTSIGAINAAYLASEDTKGKSALYAKAIDNLFRKRPHPIYGFVDLDWLFAIGFQKTEPLAFDQINEKKLRFLATKAGWWRADEVTRRYEAKSAADFMYLLQGACRAPILAGLPLGDLRGGLWDAAVWENWPMRTPLERGVTHLLVLRSSLGDDQSSFAEKSVMKVANAVFMTPSYKKQEDNLKKLIQSGQALMIQPRKQFIAPFEKRPDKVYRGIEEGKASFLKFYQDVL
jgi:predicted patatin/cPLA2 family phospholipase